MENYAAVKRCAGGQRPPLRLRKVQMGYKRCAEVARYGIIRYQAKPADAVHDHRANELRDTGMSRLRRVAGLCSRTVSDTANMRIHERTQCVSAEEKLLCRSPASQRSHVGNLRRAL